MQGYSTAEGMSVLVYSQLLAQTTVASLLMPDTSHVATEASQPQTAVCVAEQHSTRSCMYRFLTCDIDSPGVNTMVQVCVNLD